MLLPSVSRNSCGVSLVVLQLAAVVACGVRDVGEVGLGLGLGSFFLGKMSGWETVWNGSFIVSALYYNHDH